jgi:hypothetical protein
MHNPLSNRRPRTISNRLHRPIAALARRARRQHQTVVDRTGGPAERDRGGVLADVILMAGIAAGAVVLVGVVIAAVNRYGNVIAGLNP